MSAYRKDGLPSWFLVAVIFALLLAMTKQAHAAEIKKSCQLFIQQEETTQLAITGGFVMGVFQASPQGSIEEFAAAYLLNHEDSSFLDLVRQGATRVCATDAGPELSMALAKAFIAFRDTLESLQEESKEKSKRQFNQPELRS